VIRKMSRLGLPFKRRAFAPAIRRRFAVGGWTICLSQISPSATAEYPDRSATLIVEMHRNFPPWCDLSGAGLKTVPACRLPELAAVSSECHAVPTGAGIFIFHLRRPACLRCTHDEGSLMFWQSKGANAPSTLPMRGWTRNGAVIGLAETGRRSDPRTDDRWPSIADDGEGSLMIPTCRAGDQTIARRSDRGGTFLIRPTAPTLPPFWRL